jgi:hypothetical protein
MNVERFLDCHALITNVNGECADLSGPLTLHETSHLAFNNAHGFAGIRKPSRYGESPSLRGSLLRTVLCKRLLALQW